MTPDPARTRPFEIRVPDGALDDLRRRLDATRLPAPPVGEPWASGIDYGYLDELLRHWRDRFDWRRREDELNRSPQHLVEVAGQDLHVVHVRADRERYPDPVPIVLCHGWPYSFVEMLPLVPHLTDPLAHGGSVTDAFDVVVPSLPGFGFSPPLSDRPFTSDVVAELLHTLMTDGLGYERYATYGEDLGAPISDWIAARHPDAVLGLFATHAAFPPAERASDLTQAEHAFRGWLEDQWRTGNGYSRIQSTRPDTLTVGLSDSPAGLLAWVAEKLRAWSGPDFATSWTHDDVLTTVSLYWFTRTIGTSFLPYFHDGLGPSIPRVTVPVGVAVQHGERGFPREYAERTYTDVRTWSELARGGHFPAQQVPELVAAEMRAFVAPLRDH